MEAAELVSGGFGKLERARVPRFRVGTLNGFLSVDDVPDLPERASRVV